MTMKKILLAVALAATLIAGDAFATTTTNLPGDADVKPLANNKTSFAPGVEITLPALAQNDSVVTYIPFQDYYHLGWDDDGSVPTGGYAISMDLSAAGDSCAVVVGLGQRVGGPFNSPFSTALQAAVRTLATPAYSILTGTVALWHPARLCRVIMKWKGTVAGEAGRKAYVTFPREFVPPIR